MSADPASQNNIAWEKIFSKYDILRHLGISGRFNISAAQIKEFREPRLMAKFDHIINLPKIFTDNHLAILPVTRGEYVISHFEAYHKFEADTKNLAKLTVPSYIKSIDTNNITSESIALNCAAASGILEDFLQEKKLILTVSGRMSSGLFDFTINNTQSSSPSSIRVNNSQIEIDAAYEGRKSLTIFEAKLDLADDFLVRQLYYPFRLWQSRIRKPVRTVFLVYSNSIYRLYEYIFENYADYSSLKFVSLKKYSVEDTSIKMADILDVFDKISISEEPEVPFPQADKFERVINLCELLNEHELTRDEVTEKYAFDARQTNYYTDAARYLGLLEKKGSRSVPVYGLTDTGRQILALNYKQRQLAYSSLILSHKVFSYSFRIYLESGVIPQAEEIISLMQRLNIFKVESISTFKRRSSTVRSWLGWIADLIS